MTKAWLHHEVEATVADYLQMLTLELAGQQFSKTEHRRRLMRLLDDRSEAAVERKHQNISAVLIELGCPFISGYKPLGNYQQLLFDVVAGRLKGNDLFNRAAVAAVEMPATVPTIEDFSKILVDPPRLSVSVKERAADEYVPQDQQALKRDYLAREARNASLGKAGEALVVEFERWRLIANGNERLAAKIDHVSETRGDGLGYDVLSFETNGRERLIEVKTTAFGKETPFLISRNELVLSRLETERFHLYRLFDFRKNPAMFALRGAVERHCFLGAVSYLAKFS